MKNSKKIYFCAVAIFIIAMISVYSINTTKSIDNDFFLMNIEALAREESGVAMQRCRCHDDKNCYGGNAISFRKLCFSGSTNQVVTCSNYSQECK